MDKSARIVFAVAAVGTAACFVSSMISLSRDHVMSCIIFGAAGLYCLGNAIKISKKNNIGYGSKVKERTK